MNVKDVWLKIVAHANAEKVWRPWEEKETMCQKGMLHDIHWRYNIM